MVRGKPAAFTWPAAGDRPPGCGRSINNSAPLAMKSICSVGQDRTSASRSSWAQVASDWESWSIPQFLEGLAHPSAREAFARDFSAMTWADTLLAVAPMGVSSALELGGASGAGRTFMSCSMPTQRPDLMLSLVPVDHLFETRAALLEALEAPIPARWGRRPDDPAFEDGLAATLRSLNDSSQCSG